MRLLALLAAIWLAFTAPQAMAAARALGTSQERDRPHIVLIMADDLGWRDVGFNGSEIKTPHLDKLAATGKRLTRFYAHPTCSPTRASLMTGQSALRLGVTRPFSKLNPNGLPLDRKLLPEFLQEHGYQTALVGKWHLGPRKKAHLPNARGFNSFYGHVTGGVGYWDHVHGGHYDWQRDGITVRDEGYTTHLLAAEALRVVRNRNKEKPLFLYFSLGAPHLPNEAPAEALAQYAHIVSEKRRTHAAMVSEMDAAIGKLIDELDAEGIRDDTLIFFMSDNGGLTDHRLLPEFVFRVINGLESIFGKPIPGRFLEFMRTNMYDGAADNGPLRGGKSSVLEGGIRVPAIINWPGKLTDADYDGRLHVTDLLATLMDAATGGAKTGQLTDGKSMWSALAEDREIAASDFVTMGLDGKAFFSGRWKLIARNNGELQLYDIVQDETESRNLASQRPDIVEKLQDLLATSPVGESTSVPLWKVILDPDEFGGAERKAPMADLVLE